MITRRTALGAGLAFASMACAAGFGAYGPTARRGREARSIDALLIDESLEMPRQTAAFIKASRRTLPVFGIHLDAAAQTPLARVLTESHAIVGVSSGATLFCLERIAWDHGFRLTARREQCASNAGDDACRQDVAAFLGETQADPTSPSPLVRVYRPSRADGMLHAWVMRKSSPQLRPHRQEI